MLNFYLENDFFLGLVVCAIVRMGDLWVPCDFSYGAFGYIPLGAVLFADHFVILPFSCLIQPYSIVSNQTLIAS